ncbi:unnamed protein product [Euphydryas editha]|uniref:UDP-glucuronosyltransferase n=1 Tax=Euphydryas editha TaxID=104508 RepID=A0AAU9UND0_EUPED|nr:unnamed protein product [Euphydryas editha]
MLKLVFCFISVFFVSESANILGVFPTASISHQVVFRPLMLELAKRHNVTMITTDPAYPKGQTPQNFTEIDVHDISYDHWNNYLKVNRYEKGLIEYTKLLCDLLLRLVEKQIKSAEVQKLLQENKKFDLIFVESYIRPALIFAHIYDAPVIEFSSLSGFVSAFEMIGAATHPLIYPNPMHRRIYNLTLWEKVKKLYTHYSIEHIFNQHVHTENELLKTMFGPDTPDLNDLRRKVQMLFLNVRSIWDFNRPVPPNVVYLGGLHQNPQRELPEDLKSYLDSSKNGVIYMSFGTNYKESMFSSEKLKIFTRVFSQLPYDILWKWNRDELPGCSKNIKTSKWLPQSDLLRHPNVKLFITQGGLQSTDEAITAGVPLIGIPMLGDQWFNAEQYVNFKIGKLLLMETLTEEQLMDAITTIINDESYRHNIVKLRNIMNDQPEPPLERAVWWTEHVLRHGGGSYMRARGGGISWAEYYELDLVLILLTALIIFITVTVLLLRLIIFNIIHYMRFKVKTN